MKYSSNNINEVSNPSRKLIININIDFAKMLVEDLHIDLSEYVQLGTYETK